MQLRHSDDGRSTVPTTIDEPVPPIDAATNTTSDPRLLMSLPALMSALQLL